MHDHYGMGKAVEGFGQEKLHALLIFREKFLREELTELGTAITEHDPEGIVDALIDLCVVAIGTLDLFKVDPIKAWNVVHDANMAKQVGIKEGRPNPLGLPDLVKPPGWTAPSHEGNYGLLSETFGE